MGERVKHPARDKNELRAELRLKLFEILITQEQRTPDYAADKAKEISDKFTEDYDS